MTRTNQIIATGFALAMSISGSAVLAKGHDQSNTATPGDNVKEETVCPAQGLGSALGGGKGPRGNSNVSCG